MEGNNHTPQPTSSAFVRNFLWVAELPLLLPLFAQVVTQSTIWGISPLCCANSIWILVVLNLLSLLWICFAAL